MLARFVTPENKKWWTLGAVSVGLFMIMLDNTVVNVALPSMRSSLHMSLSELEWVVAGYALTFAAFMLIGGKLADFLGRRLVFMIGLAVFTGASLACGLAPNGGFLIGARIVQGLGGALMNPATLSIIAATFAPRERGRAIGIWAGVSGLGIAIGPVTGGWLIEHYDWSSIFLVNLPVVVLALAAGRFLVPESLDESAPRLDLGGFALSVAGLVSLTWGLIEAPERG
jgi:MFS family permease